MRVAAPAPPAVPPRRQHCRRREKHGPKWKMRPGRHRPLTPLHRPCPSLQPLPALAPLRRRLLAGSQLPRALRRAQGPRRGRVALPLLRHGRQPLRPGAAGLLGRDFLPRRRLCDAHRHLHDAAAQPRRAGQRGGRGRPAARPLVPGPVPPVPLRHPRAGRLGHHARRLLLRPAAEARADAHALRQRGGRPGGEPDGHPLLHLWQERLPRPRAHQQRRCARRGTGLGGFLSSPLAYTTPLRPQAITPSWAGTRSRRAGSTGSSSAGWPAPWKSTACPASCKRQY